MAIVARVLQLPQELQDNIYTHLWEMNEKQDPSRSMLYWWDSFDEPWFSVDDDIGKSRWLRTPLMNLRPPHFIDKCFVGPIFAKEALQTFKDSVGKDLRPVGEKSPVAECGLLDTSMEDFAKKDVFGVGVTMEELVRNLDLRVNFQCDALTDDEFAEVQKGKVHDQGSLVTDTTEYTREDYLCDLNDGVTALLGIPPTERITTHNEHGRLIQTRARVVTLAIRQEDDFISRDHSAILKLVARAYHGLRPKGFTVKVQYYSEEIELKVLFEDDVWEWSVMDWDRNLFHKNTFGIGQGTSPQRYVWAQLQYHLFQKPDEDVLP
ncbi:hypothetical protein G6011_10042 [Alternaria panax]|uniref:Uncharacterized protein n=1 Tax=Alternaria panax TaxID=48097 RepID=A0AAD4FG59_9PLEO|nr:hypothetical protein G6011_10042 [Alternaria panax]